MTHGLTLTAPDSPLTDRAADFLAGGPADAQALISYVCQLPGAPLTIAEHMATALFAGHVRFARDRDGRWRLHDGRVAANLAMPAPAGLQDASFIVVDVETTGTRAYGGDRITEVAAVLVRRGSVTTLFDSLINPERPIPAFVTRLTNISWKMVKNAPRFGDVCDQLLGALEGHVFVAHNVRFDWRFLSMEINRATGRALHGRRLCTVALARKLLPNLRRRSLDQVTNYYGIEITARHRAGGDAVATAHVLKRLLAESRNHGCTTVDDLERLARIPAPRRRRPRRPPALPRSAGDDASA